MFLNNLKYNCGKNAYITVIFYLTGNDSCRHLPETLVAAFAKRLARISLVTTPENILIILPFIGNLLLRHPGLKKLINHPTGGQGKNLVCSVIQFLSHAFTYHESFYLFSMFFYHVIEIFSHLGAIIIFQ